MGEQTNAFAGDRLDPYVAKVADRFVELLVQKKMTDDSLKVQKKNLCGLLRKHKKTVIRHHGVEIRIKVVAEKEELTVKQLKPVDGKKSKPKKVR